MLRELAEIGMRVARALAERTEAEAAARVRAAEGAAPAEARGGPQGDPELGFARLSRAVRLTLAMERKVAEDEAARLAGAALARELATFGRPPPPPNPADGPEAALEARILARQERITETIERSLEPEAYPGEHKELLWEIDWTVDEAGDDPEFLDRPFPEAVARIRAALDLEPDPTVEGMTDAEDERRAAEAADGGAAEDAPDQDAPDEDGFRSGP
jgi:hypothetical protein